MHVRRMHLIGKETAKYRFKKLFLFANDRGCNSINQYTLTIPEHIILPYSVIDNYVYGFPFLLIINQ